MTGRILFVTSNGTGLGHLTRGMAIARRFEADRDPAFLTLSAAAPVVEEVGFHVEYFPSHSAAAAESPRRWDRRLRRRLDLLLDELRPEILVFDGAHPYDALIAVLRARRGSGMQTVWCRRPMWRQGFGSEAIYWAQEFDAVLEPGELAESEDRGLTASRRGEAERVGPVVFLDPDELLSREDACRELGLDPSRPHALVALGQGPALDTAVARSLDCLTRDPGIQVAALGSSLSPRLVVPAGVVHLKGTYPMSRFFRAFDLAVAAAGYNGFHELLAHGVPSLFVPMPRQIDDQAARARWAQLNDVGRGVEGPADPILEQRLGELLEPSTRERIRSNLAKLPAADGAAAAAAWLTELTEHAEQGERGSRTEGEADSDAADPRFAAARSADERGRRVRSRSSPGSKDERRRRVRSRFSPGSKDERNSRVGNRSATTALSVSIELVRRVGPRLPLIVARRLRDRFRDPPPAHAKLAAVAFGLDPAELIERLEAVAAAEGVEHRRLLAITDSLEFGALREAGFAFEYVPSPERAARIGEMDYPRFAHRRIEAALAGRRKARRAVLAAP